MSKDANKERALAALLDAPTMSAAAVTAGLSRRTVYEYLRSDRDFALRYKQQRQLRAIEQAEQAAGEREAALQAIRDVMNDVDQPGAVRLKAAERLLDVANAGVGEQRQIADSIVEAHNPLWSGFDL